MDVPLVILALALLTGLSGAVSAYKKALLGGRAPGARAGAAEVAVPPREALLTLLIVQHLLWIVIVVLAATLPAWPAALAVTAVVYLWVGRLLPRLAVSGREAAVARSGARAFAAAHALAAPLRRVLERAARGAPLLDRDCPPPAQAGEAYEREMIQNVLEFGETRVKEVMTPRPDMFCVELGRRLAEVAEEVRAAGFSRVPVYHGDRDHIEGILYAKDLLPRLARGIGRDEVLDRALLRPAPHVPETKRVHELLRDFRKQNVHIAMVVDEYGGVEGLVCLEDLLEEIVGEIQDEGDREAPLVEALGDGAWRISAMLPVAEFNERFGLSLPEEDVETMGGFVVERLGHFPKWGERLRVDGLEISVHRVRGVRVLDLLVTRCAGGPAAREEGW